MPIAVPSMSISPLPIHGPSAVDFGAKIENVDLETLNGE